MIVVLISSLQDATELNDREGIEKTDVIKENSNVYCAFIGWTVFLRFLNDLANVSPEFS